MILTIKDYMSIIVNFLDELKSFFIRGNGWTPVLALVNENGRSLLKVIDWKAGTNEKPEANLYVGDLGFFTDSSLAHDFSGITSEEAVEGNLVLFADESGLKLKNGGKPFSGKYKDLEGIPEPEVPVEQPPLVTVCKNSTIYDRAPNDEDTENPFFYYNSIENSVSQYVKIGGKFRRIFQTFLVNDETGEPESPEEAVNKMTIGMNTTWVNDWANAWCFSNMMYHARFPDKVSGNGSYTYNHGEFISEDPEAIYRLPFGNRGRIPVGTYTVNNPDGLRIAIGGWNKPAEKEWTNATSFTFDVIGGGNDQGPTSLFIKGSLTNTKGLLTVIAPGQKERWESGNVWSDVYVNFLKGMKLDVLRTMDLTVASGNFETEWNERSLPNKQHVINAWGNREPSWEQICQLANEVGVDPWVCVPHRATIDYVENMARVFKNHLNADRKVWIELGNEIWNWGGAWAGGSHWMDKLDFTKKKATADVATQSFFCQDHGLLSGMSISTFRDVSSTIHLNDDKITNWRLTNVGGGTAKVLDKDRFEINYSETGEKIPFSKELVKIIFMDNNEPGKRFAQDINYAKVSKRNWDIFDAIVGRDRVVHLIATQVAYFSKTKTRMQDPEIVAATDYVAGAPYFGGTWCGGKLNLNSGLLSVSWWASEASTEFTLKVNDVELKKFKHTNGSLFSDVISISDVSEAKVEISFSYRGVEFNVSKTIVGSEDELVSELLTLDYSQMFLINMLNVDSDVRNEVEGTKANTAGRPFICYEGGLHFNESAPDEIRKWLDGYQTSAQYAQAVDGYLRYLAALDTKSFCYYADVLGTTFSISDSYSNTSDPRYLKFVELAGSVDKFPLPNKEKIVLPNIKYAPTTYPYPIGTLDSGALVYFADKSDEEKFEIRDAVLYLKQSDLDFAIPTRHLLNLIVVKNGLLSQRQVSFATGNAWYEVDSSFVWSAKHEGTDTSVMTPLIGNDTVKPKGNKLATTDGEWWNFSGASYYSQTVQEKELDYGKPFLIAFSRKYFNPQFRGNCVASPTGGVGISYERSWSNPALQHFRLYRNGREDGIPLEESVSVNQSTFDVPQVIWLYNDGKGTFTGGFNQVVDGSAHSDLAPLIKGSRNFYVSDFDIYLGSYQILQRENMILEDALQVVAKMQQHHNIE